MSLKQPAHNRGVYGRSPPGLQDRGTVLLLEYSEFYFGWSETVSYQGSNLALNVISENVTEISS